MPCDLADWTTFVAAPAFTFDEQCFDGGDVVLAAVAWGEWQALERALADDLAHVAACARRGERVDLYGAVVSFRRARRLASGEDYRRWLEVRSLTTADVDAHLLRIALREGNDVEPEETDRPGLDEVRQAVRGEVILSGRLRAWAERLSACAAAARYLEAARTGGAGAERDRVGGVAAGEGAVTTLGAVTPLREAAGRCRLTGLEDDAVDARAPRVAELIAAEQAAHALVASRVRIERCLARHRLDWQRVRWREMETPSEGAAREAALLVREDGLGLAEVAELAHATVEERTALCCEVPELAGTLIAAVPGELLGPRPANGSWQLILVEERIPPASDDDEIRRRAEDELVAEALERHLAGRVSWHGEL